MELERKEERVRAETIAFTTTPMPIIIPPIVIPPITLPSSNPLTLSSYNEQPARKKRVTRSGRAVRPTRKLQGRYL